MGRTRKIEKVYFLANDPGGVDAIYPIFERFNYEKDCIVELMLTGTASERNIVYKKNRDEVLNILENEKYGAKTILVTGTSWGNDIEIKAIKKCKQKGIKTIAIIDYWSNYTKRFFLNGEYVYPDYVFIMDYLAVSEACLEGLPSAIIKVTGQPGLDKYVKKRILCKGTGAIFISQPLSSIYGTSLGYTEEDALIDIQKATNNLGISLCVKFHPKDSKEFKKKYQDIAVDESLEDICKKYRYIIGMSSMAMLQCYLMGGNIISYQPGLSDTDLSITNKLGLGCKAFTYKDLLDCMKMPKIQRDKDSIPFWVDGESTDRCCEEIYRIMGRREL